MSQIYYIMHNDYIMHNVYQKGVVRVAHVLGIDYDLDLYKH